MVHPDIAQEKVNLPLVRLRIKGIIDIDKVYKVMAEWFKENKYFFIERGYAGKIKPLSEFKLEWRAKRDVDEYFRFNMDIEFFILRQRDVNVGNKTMQNLEVELTFRANYEKNWQKTFRYEWMRRIYETYFIRKKINKYEGKLYAERNALINKAKDVIGMHRA